VPFNRKIRPKGTMKPVTALCLVLFTHSERNCQKSKRVYLNFIKMEKISMVSDIFMVGRVPETNIFFLPYMKSPLPMVGCKI
jgi:hypothetical protein